ncbi:MAG: GGDEF domain-containing protein, partial [Candidatus Dadabacteria bacterium]
PPSERIDPVTGLRDKSSILSPRAIDKLDQKLGKGKPKVVLYFDFDHLSVPNRFGMRKELDALLGHIKAIAEESFGVFGVNFELIRIGGDEFACIVQDTPETAKAISHFVNQFQELRERFLPSDDPRYKKAARFAAIREGMRGVLASYKREIEERGVDFSLERYREYILEEIKKLSPEDFARLKEVQSPGKLAFNLVALKIRSGELPSEVDVATVTAAAVRVPSLSCQSIHLAVGSADKEIHRRKEERGNGDSTKDVAIQNLDESVRIRDSLYNEMGVVATMERNFRSFMRIFRASPTMGKKLEWEEKLRELQLSDAAIGIPRLNLAEGIRAKNLPGLMLDKRTTLYVAYIDNPYHASSNHEESPDIADGDAYTLSCVAGAFKFCAGLTRVNGGAQLVIMKDEASREEIKRELGILKAQVSGVISAEKQEKGRAIIEKLYAQFDLRRALLELTGFLPQTDHAPPVGTITVKLTEVEVDPNDTLQAVYGNLLEKLQAREFEEI